MVDLMCHINMRKGWRCTRGHHSEGPCALVPRWWNIRDRWFVWRMFRMEYKARRTRAL